jgi:biotin transport system substrate-specific component
MAQTTSPAEVHERSLAAQLALDFSLTAAFTLVIAAGAHLRLPLPFTPVPLTLQTLAVLLAGALLGPRLGFAAATGYLLLSLLGLPVMAGPSFIGPTGGYVLGFILAAVIMGLCVQRGSWGWLVGGAVTASLTILLCGSLWLGAYTGQDWARAFQLGALPFLPGDALKTVAAVLIVRRFGPQVRRIVG